MRTLGTNGMRPLTEDALHTLLDWLGDVHEEDNYDMVMVSAEPHPGKIVIVIDDMNEMDSDDIIDALGRNFD